MDAELCRTTGPATTERRGVARQRGTETKAAYKTTEFVCPVVLAGILLASFPVKTGQDDQRPDDFQADKAWWYITLLTIGYMIARGLAAAQPPALRPRPPIATVVCARRAGADTSADGSRARYMTARLPPPERSPT
jgi:hypothetical protein